MAKKIIFSIDALKKKKYQSLELDPCYTELMGTPERVVTILMYGESGSGKSVYALKFAEYFANTFGKSFYNSHEEGANQTIQDRINNFNINANRLWIGDCYDFEELCDHIQRTYCKLIVIDSVKYMRFTVEQLKELRERFARRQLSIVMIDFGASKGNPASGKDLLHASDIKMYFKDGMVHSISRYLKNPVKKRLFIPQTEKKQPTLFD